MNLDTLLFEVDKLGLRRFFCSECRRENFSKEVCTHAITPYTVTDKYTYVCWGNIVICAYDKGEVFLELLKKDTDANNQLEEAEDFDQPDGLVTGSLKEHPNWDQVYFFDDEDVNIYNFGRIVANSNCILVQTQKTF